jgi:hypothetical protein
MKIFLFPVIALTLISCTKAKPSSARTSTVASPDAAPILKTKISSSSQQIKDAIAEQFPANNGYSIRTETKTEDAVAVLFSERVEARSALGAIGFGGEDFFISQANNEDAADLQIGYFYARFPTEELAQNRYLAIHEKVRSLKSKIITPVKTVRHGSDLVVYYTESQGMTEILTKMR